MARSVETRGGEPHHHPAPATPRFIQHSSNPHNMGLLVDADGRGMAVGSCGDSIEITLRLQEDRIVAIGHVPRGCCYTVACASAVTSLARGRTVDEALSLQPEDVAAALGGLPPDHHHCARLAINTLGEAIADAYRHLAHTGRH